jgi:hypothetical protein
MPLFTGDFCDTFQFHEDGMSGYADLAGGGRVLFAHDVSAPLLVMDGQTATLWCP